MTSPSTGSTTPGHGQQRERVRTQSRTSVESHGRARVAARSRILDAGACLLAKDGLEGTNSNEIARSAGVGVGTFYGHFADKHALHRALVRSAYETLQTRLASAARAGAPELEDQVRRLVAALCDFATDAPDLFRVAFGRPAPAARPGEPALAFSTRPVAQRLAQLQRLGQLAADIDPAVAARASWVMQTGVVLQWLDGRLEADRQTIIGTLTRLHPALCGSVS